MKRILTFSALAVSALSLASCASQAPPPVVHNHYYRTTNTRYVPSSPATVIHSKSAGVSSGYNSPEAFEAVTPPSSYSR